MSGAIARAFPALEGETGPIDPAVTPGKNPKLGDFQCNAAMSLGKLVGKPPREVAAALVAELAGDAAFAGVAEPVTAASVAGPGFINITLRSDALARMVERIDLARPCTALRREQVQTIVVDLCGVNLAKQLHVGHLRSTVIGDTMARVLEGLGHRVIRQNHVGDWGVPIAMVISRLMDQSKAGLIDLKRVTLKDLDDAYKAAKAESSAESVALREATRWHMGPKLISEIEAQVAPALEAEAKGKGVLLALQAKQPDVLAVWKLISDVTMESCLAVCRDLNANITEEHTAGESFYGDLLAPMVVDLEKRGVAEVSDGALIIRINDERAVVDGAPAEGGFEMPPTLIRKRDGGYLYATTDVAAIRYRVQTLGADRVVYCVGAPQITHFKQIFGAAHKAGYDTRVAADGSVVHAELIHAAFGAILGQDGKPFKTRAGSSAKLQDLLDLAMERAMAAVSERNAEMLEAQRVITAKAVAAAALRYTDLSSERIKDYVFIPERMVAFEGNTGPYLLYALVRVRSIARKLAELHGAGAAAEATQLSIVIAHPAEKALGLLLLRYPEVVRDVGRSLEPHRLCAYVYELASAFSQFFDACPVATAPQADVRASRVRLCAAVEATLASGLTMLGIPLLDRM